MEFKDLHLNVVARMSNNSPNATALRTLLNLPVSMLPEVEPACWDCPIGAWYIQHGSPRTGTDSSDLKTPFLMAYCQQLHMTVWSKLHIPIMECTIRERVLKEQQIADEIAGLM